MEIKNETVAKSRFSEIGSIKGTRLDPDSKGSIWEHVGSTKVRLKENFLLPREDVPAMSKADFDKFVAVLQDVENSAVKKLIDKKVRADERLTRIESIVLINALNMKELPPPNTSICLTKFL